MKKVLPDIIKKSDLPEGVHIANPLEKEPPEPFVVISNLPSTDEALDQYHRGAIGYTAMNYDFPTLQRRLSEIAQRYREHGTPFKEHVLSDPGSLLLDETGK